MTITKTILAGVAFTAMSSTAIAAPMHHHAKAMKASSGSDATKMLNQKSLEQASGGSSGGAMMSSGAGANSGMSSPAAAPMGAPADGAMPAGGMTPPATPQAPQ